MGNPTVELKAWLSNSWGRSCDFNSHLFDRQEMQIDRDSPPSLPGINRGFNLGTTRIYPRIEFRNRIEPDFYSFFGMGGFGRQRAFKNQLRALAKQIMDGNWTMEGNWSGKIPSVLIKDLVKIGSEAIPPLVQVLKNKGSDWDLRWEAASALEEIGENDAQAVHFLIETAIQDPDWGVRAEAAWALGILIEESWMIPNLYDESLRLSLQVLF